MEIQELEKAARIERERIHKELQDGYKSHKDINLYTAFSVTIDQYAIPLFRKGAEWRINSVWHDATEKPKLGEMIIVECFGKIWDYGKYDVCDTIHPKARWAYMKDLIPNNKD